VSFAAATISFDLTQQMHLKSLRMPKPDDAEILSIDGPVGLGKVDVRISSPTKPYFTRQAHLSKIDIARYFLAVAPGALAGIQGRPIVLKRFVNGAEAEPFYQKRAPSDLPAWMRTVTLSFPSGRTAEEVVVDNAPGLLWIVNLGCMELHPHPVLASDLDHPNELRVDLDPTPGVDWSAVREVTVVARAVLEEHGLTAFPKTSGSRGMHLNVPIHPRWSFTEVRRAALALAREVERRAPTLATSKWWKEERHGVFLDYNQNAKDRTTASAYSVRPLPDARVSAPLRWEEVSACDPEDFTVLTMPARFAAIGNPHQDMYSSAGSLKALLDLAARDEASGLGDAPWPPHFAKQEGEGKRVQPSKAKAFSDQIGEGFGAKRFKKQSAKNATALQSAITSGGNHDSVGHGFSSVGHGFSRDNQEAHQDAASAAEGNPAGAKKLARRTRTPKQPLLTIAQSPDKSAAEAGLSRWKEKFPEAARYLAIDDVLVDRMRGSSYVWYRIRINLRHVPEDQRPAQETPDPDDDPTHT
jgi:bifunctional non-homologous end joining protein LigD